MASASNTKASSKRSQSIVSSKTSRPESRRKLNEDMLTSVVEITTRGDAGKNFKTVHLHENMMEEKSPYLARMAAMRTGPNLQLLDLDSDAFGTFAVWFYSDQVTFSLGNSNDPPDAGDILASVLDCYCLAQKLEAKAFANAVLRHACIVSAKKGLVFGNPLINAIYKRTIFGSALRRWIVDEWVLQLSDVNETNLKWADHKGLVKEFLFDVVKAQRSRLGGGNKKHEILAMTPRRYEEDNWPIVLD